MSTKVLSVRVKHELRSTLESLAEKRHLKLNDLIQEALYLYIENYAGYAIALERLNNNNDELLEGELFTERLGWG